VCLAPLVARDTLPPWLTSARLTSMIEAAVQAAFVEYLIERGWEVTTDNADYTQMSSHPGVTSCCSPRSRERQPQPGLTSRRLTGNCFAGYESGLKPPDMPWSCRSRPEGRPFVSRMKCGGSSESTCGSLTRLATFNLSDDSHDNHRVFSWWSIPGHGSLSATKALRDTVLAAALGSAPPMRPDTS
jgi:hypothetical protein